jgi:hypothetical protein
MDTALEVINYEIMMFFFTRKGVGLQGNPADIQLTNNALVESRVLHIRVLTEFLLSQKENRDSDIKLIELLPQIHAQHGTLIEALRTAYYDDLPVIGKNPKTLIDQLLAHATTKRDASFNWTPVIERMDQPLVNLLKVLPPGEFPSLSMSF